VSRSFGGASGLAAAQPNIRPAWLVAIYFTSGTVRLSSRGDYTFGGNLFSSAGITVDGEQLSLYNENSQFTAAFINQRTPVSIDVWEAFGNGPLPEVDFDYVFNGEIASRNVGETITASLRPLSIKPEPHIYIQPPTFNWLPPREAVILTPTGSQTLPAPPTASQTQTPPAHYNSVTLPPWVPPVAPASSINTQPNLAEILANFAAEGAVVPIHYGAFQFGGLPFAMKHSSGTWTVGYVVGLGQIEAIDNVWINGAAPVSGVVVNTYTGTTGQTADPLLVAAIAGYADTLVHSDDGVSIGIAYVVIQYTNTHYPSFPSVIVAGRGRRVFDPQTSTTAYSTSPALALRDFLASVMGDPVNAASVTALKTACAATVGGEARRLIGITIDRAQSPEQWIEVLRTYACAYVWKRADTWHLLADRPASSIRTLYPRDVARGSLKVSLPDIDQAPTVVRCQYTDTSGSIWKTGEALSEDSGVSTGASPRINSQVRLPGIHRYSQATREAIERRKKLARALKVEFQAFAEHSDLEFGDVFTLSGFIHLAGDKVFRIVAPPRRVGEAHVRIAAVEYDASVYDDTVPSAPGGGGVKVIGETILPGAGQDGMSVYVSLSASNLFQQAPNGGAWSHTTCDATFTWKRGATTLATHVVRATLNTGTGLITVATQGTPTGDATTATLPAAAAPIRATVAHDTSGVSHSIGFNTAQGGSAGAPGTSSTSPVANFGGQWGGLGDLVLKPNFDLSGANNGEIVLEGAGGAGWVVYHGPTLTPRAGSRVALLTPWEGDVSAELGARDNTFYVMEGATTAFARWGGSFQALSAVTVAYEATGRVWKAYADTTGSGTVFTPLTTDIIVAVGYKVSTTGGIDRLTPLIAGFKLTASTIALFLDAAVITAAQIQDAAITNAKIASLDAAKITTGLLQASRINLDGITLQNVGGLLQVGTADWQTNIGGTGKPDNYATRNPESYFEDFSQTTLAQWQADWTLFTSSGEQVVYADSSPIGNRILRLGNNSGNDEVSAHLKVSKAVAIKQDQLYMCRMVVARLYGASAQLILGVAGVKDDKSTLINASGATGTPSNQFFWGLNGGVPGTSWVEYVFWFKRTGGAVSNVYYPTNTPKNPAIIHADAHYAVPIFYTSYPGQAGDYAIALVELRPYDPPEWNSNIIGQPADSAILNTSAVIFRHLPVLSWLSFGNTSGDYSPPGATQSTLIEVVDAAGNLVASRNVSGTITFSNGQIAVTSDTVSGIQVTTTNNNTQNVTVTITYGGKTSTMYFMSLSTSVSGVGK